MQFKVRHTGRDTHEATPVFRPNPGPNEGLRDPRRRIPEPWAATRKVGSERPLKRGTP